MQRCGYGRGATKTGRTCGKPAIYLAELRRLTPLCGHHAGIAAALGWRVRSIEQPEVAAPVEGPRRPGGRADERMVC